MIHSLPLKWLYICNITWGVFWLCNIHIYAESCFFNLTYCFPYRDLANGFFCFFVCFFLSVSHFFLECPMGIWYILILSTAKKPYFQQCLWVCKWKVQGASSALFYKNPVLSTRALLTFESDNSLFWDLSCAL